MTDPGPAASARHALYALGSGEPRIIEHAAWVEARDAVVAALEQGYGIVALVGPEGSGRRTLARNVADTVRVSAPVAVLADADRIEPPALDRALEQAHGPVLLTGSTALAHGMAERWPETAIVPLEAVRSTDESFLEALCGQAGQPASLIGTEAAADLVFAAHGRPGAIAALTRIAALIAAVLRADRIEPPHVEAALRLFEQRPSLPSSEDALAPFLPPERGERPGATSRGSVFADRPRFAPEEAFAGAAQPRRRARLKTFAAGAAILAFVAFLWSTTRDQSAQPQTAGLRPEEPTPAPAPAAAPAPVPVAVPAPPAARNAAREILPVFAPPRIRTRYPADDAAAKADAAALAARIRAAGYETAEPAQGPPFPDGLTVGFYFFEDRAAASAAAREADRPPSELGLLVVPQGEAMPPPGTVDIFVPGEGQK